VTAAVTWLVIAGLYIGAWWLIRHMGRTDNPPVPPYDWATEDDPPDVDLEYRKLWAANFPEDYRRNYRKELA